MPYTRTRVFQNNANPIGGGSGPTLNAEVLNQWEAAHQDASDRIGGLAVNVHDFGAKGDGVTDDSAAFTSAMTAAARVFVPAGAYLLGSRLTAVNNTQLCGTGRDSTVLKAGAGVAGAVIIGTSGGTVTNFSITDLTIDGGYAMTGASVNGIQITNGANFAAANIRVTNVGGSGILLQGLNAGGGTAHSSITGCVIDGTGLANSTTGFGVQVKDASTYCYINGNDIRNVVGGMGIGLAGSVATGYPTHCTITDNIILMSPSTTGFEAIGLTAGCTHAVIANNNIKDSYDNGISVTAGSCTVTGNIIDGTYNHGIASGGDGTTITGNFIRNVGRQDALAYGGIALAEASHNVVIGNRIVDDQTTHTMSHAVKLTTSAGNNLVALNVAQGFSVSAYSGQAATDVIVDPGAQTNGLTFDRVYMNELRAATAGAALIVGNDIRLTGRNFFGAAATGPAQANFSTNAGSTRPQAAFVAVVGQSADLWQSVASDGTTVLAGAKVTGRLFANDGITTKDLGDVTGKTSAQIDALFASVPPDGTLATGLLSATPVTLARRNGKWNYTNQTVIV